MLCYFTFSCSSLPSAVLSPVIVSIEKDKVVNVKKVNENLDDFSIESIIREENNTKINVFYPVTKCTKANNFIQEKIDYYIQKIQENSSIDGEKSLNISFEKYNSDNIVSIKFEVDSNVGITHKTKEYFTVSYSGDEMITIDTLIDNNPKLLDDLYDECKEQLERDEKFRKYSNEIWLSNGLKKTKNTFSNFIFSENKLIVIFNPYTVAPFVAGVFEIEISYDLI